MKNDPQTSIEVFLRANYPVGTDLSILPISKGEENQNFLVKADDAKYVLRVYSTHHSTTGLRRLPEIEFELDWMEAANSHRVPTPPVILTQTGLRVSTITIEGQTRFAVLFGYAQGEEAVEYTEEIAYSTAQTLLALRRASMAFQRQNPRSWPGDIIGLSLGFYTANRDRMVHHRDLLENLYHAASVGYAQAIAANLPTGIIHGDIKLGNLLFKGDHMSAVIDFDDYRHSYLLEEFTRAVLHDLDSATRNVIRSGYFSVFRDAFVADPTVTAEEKAYLGVFLKARLVYDLTTYTLAGLDALVEEVLADPQVRKILLA